MIRSIAKNLLRGGKAAIFFASLLPLAVSAQTAGVLETFLIRAADLLNLFITFLLILATAIFLWGIVKYIMAGGDEDQVKEARGYILWGVIFLAVMVAVWGFVNIVLDFVIGGTVNTPYPIPVGPQRQLAP